MGYHSVFKDEGILTHVTAWVDPAVIVLRDMSQSQRGKGVITFVRRFQSTQIHKDKKGEWVLPGARRGGWGALKGTVHTGEDGKAPEVDGGDGCTTV